MTQAYSVVFGPDGTRIATGGSGTVKIWDAITGQETLTLKRAWGESIAFSPDGTRIASPNHDGRTVKIWDARPVDNRRPAGGPSSVAQLDNRLSAGRPGSTAQ